MTNSIDNKVQGKAVYLEFIRNGMTQQVLIMPEGVSTSHKTVPMTIFRRRLTSTQPRKTWKASASSHTSVSLLTSAATAMSEKSVIVDTMLSFLTPLMHSLQVNGYQLYKAPVVVEVTSEDLEQARVGKTPYKAMGRVWKARKHLGFPKEYIHTF